MLDLRPCFGRVRDRVGRRGRAVGCIGGVRCELCRGFLEGLRAAVAAADGRDCAGARPRVCCCVERPSGRLCWPCVALSLAVLSKNLCLPTMVFTVAVAVTGVVAAAFVCAAEGVPLVGPLAFC